MTTRVVLAALVAVAGLLVTGSAASPAAWAGAVMIVFAVAWSTRDRTTVTPPSGPAPEPAAPGSFRVWLQPPPPTDDPDGTQVVEVDGLVVRARVETRLWLLIPPPSVSPNPDYVAPTKHRIVLDMTWHGTEDTKVWFRPFVLERQPPTGGDILFTHDTMQLKPQIEVLLDTEPASVRVVGYEDMPAIGVWIPIAAGTTKQLVLAALTDYDDVVWQLQFTWQADDPTSVKAFELRTTANTGSVVYSPDGTVRPDSPNDYDREYTVRIGDGITDPPAPTV
ncbi:hypothetical protein [Saccharothrix variisporea]|uniref:Uncharacterized protein n=1 Tax=Saccharothrix variisporea TaxID=543527 RepID=A0A495XL65_9PSEU|nr:hypothetical protein [Saccharothrix variisporea]RKT74389.1 hypothetical protein DFJ66_7738 [Saccharothrix variisporea]